MGIANPMHVAHIVTRVLLMSMCWSFDAINIHKIIIAIDKNIQRILQNGINYSKSRNLYS